MMLPARRARLEDGTEITLRPIRPEDAAMEQAFVRRLSPESRHFRFMEALRELSPEMLERFTRIDYSKDCALLATLAGEGGEVQIGVARYFLNPDGDSAEFALAVADDWQHRGVGTLLMEALAEAARAGGVKVLEGEVLADNGKMRRLMRELGFSESRSPDEPGLVAVRKRL